MSSIGVSLTEAQREEMAVKAFDMSVRGLSDHGIGEVLGVNRKTATKLRKQEQQRRKVERPDTADEAIAGYRAVIEDCWDRLGRLKDTSVNVSGAWNNIIAALKAIDDINGTRAPLKYDVHKTVENIDLSEVPQELLENFVRAQEALMAHAQAVPSQN